MKILFLGDYSNYHNSLAEALALRGHDVTVASNGSRWMDTHRNINLRRRPGKLGGALLWAKLNTVLASKLKGYDVVQICTPLFVELKPERNRALFDRVKRDNGRVFMSMLGTDPNYIQQCISGNVLKYSEWNIGSELAPYARARQHRMREWLTPQMVDHCKYIYDHVDGIVAALYEYYLTTRQTVDADRLAYAGIPIAADADEPKPLSLAPDAPMRIMLACHRGRELEKGVDLMLPALQRLVEEHPDMFHLDFVQNVPFEQFRQLLDDAHVVVDQLYSYTPATTALMAMRKGKVVVSGAEPEYYDFIGERELQPIINADPMHPQAIADNLLALANDPALYDSMAAQGPAFVAKHNDAGVVAARFETFWNSKL